MLLEIKTLARKVTEYLGDALLMECHPAESPFPGIEDRVRILAPGILTNLLMVAHHDALTVVKSFPSQVTITEAGTVYLKLPTDFLKLHVIKMSGWSREVTEVADTGTTAYLLQSSACKSLRGSPQRPRSILSYDDSGNRVLKLFSSGAGEKLEYGYYIARPEIDGADRLEVDPYLLYDLIKAIAETIGGDAG